MIDRRVRTFSRGMRQRLGLADALIKNPSILILDEPTVNIDPEGVRELLAFVRDLRNDEGMTVLLSSHLLHQVEQVCDRIGIFVSGQLVGLGTVAELAGELEDSWMFELGVDPGPSTTQLAEAIGAVPGVSHLEVDGPGRWMVNAEPRRARRAARAPSARPAAPSTTSCAVAPTSTRSITTTSSGARMTATIASAPDAPADQSAPTSWIAERR